MSSPTISSASGVPIIPPSSIVTVKELAAGSTSYNSPFNRLKLMVSVPSGTISSKTGTLQGATSPRKAIPRGG
jgi:hypothetical protein